MRRLNLAPAFEPLEMPFPDDCPNISGDPHVLTFDGLHYDFQAVGEFVAMRSDDDEVEVQVRLAPVGGSDRVSIVDGVAAEVDGRRLIVDGRSGAASLDGQAIGVRFEAATRDGGLVLRRDGLLTALWPDHSTAITVTGLGRVGHLNFYATLDAARAGRVSGLLGNADADPANDISLPGGTVLSDDFTSIHRDFRDAWRVADADLLLHGRSTFDPSLPAAPAEVSREQQDAARVVCIEHGVLVRRVLDDCTFDVAVTDDETYAERYAVEQRPRRVTMGECAGGAPGTLVYMAGGGPQRTYETAGRLISGELAWQFSLEREPPAVVQGVAATRGGFVVVDGRRGFHWTDSAGRILATAQARPRRHVPAVTTQRVFGVVSEGVLALSHDGTTCWQLNGYEGEVFASVGFADDQLLATSTTEGVGSVLAIDPATGMIHWSRSFPHPIEDWAAADGSLVIGSAGMTLAMDAHSGDYRWRHQDGFLVVAVAIADETAYALDLNRGLAAHDVATGTQLWRYLPRPDEAFGFTSHLAVTAERLIVVNEAYALGLDPVDGSPSWVLGRDGERARYSQPVVAGEVVYFVRDDKTLVGHAVSDGQRLTRVELPQRAREAGPPLPWGDTVLVVDRDGTLRAYR